MTVAAQNTHIRRLIWRMYRDAADEYYIVARWAAKTELYHQFFWSAQQAIEKYLKGAILLNGCHTKNLNHGLLSALSRLKPISNGLLPILLCPPKYFPTMRHGAWGQFEPFDQFIERIGHQGSPAVRYRHHSLQYRSADLHKFDEVCFQLRRVNFPLDMEYDGLGITVREYLEMSPNHQPHAPNFKDTRRRGSGSNGLDEIAAWRNYSYFESKAKEDGVIYNGFSFVNSEISLIVDGGAESREALEWLLASATFSKAEQEALFSNLSSRIQR